MIKECGYAGGGFAVPDRIVMFDRKGAKVIA